MAKILRLQKQQRFLDTREKEMLSCGLSTLDELDAAKAVKRENAARFKASSSALFKASAFFNDPSLDPEPFADLPLFF
jgi:hypothetical protein